MIGWGHKNALLKIAQCVTMPGIETKNICRIQWDVFLRHIFKIKNPTFLHIFIPRIVPNLNVGLLSAFVATFLSCVSAFGATPTSSGGCLAGYIGSETITTTISANRCSESATVYMKGESGRIKITYCTTCSSGTLQNTTAASDNLCGTITYQTCLNSFAGGDVSTGSSCTQDTDCGIQIPTVSYPEAGYIKYSRPACKQVMLNNPNKQCTTSATYKCNTGYYGTSPSCSTLGTFAGCSGCTRCPQDINGTAGTSNAGAQSENDCYVPSDRSLTDTSGTYNHSQDCVFKGCSSSAAITGTCTSTTGTVGELGVPGSTSGYYCWCCIDDKCTYVRNYFNSLYGDASSITLCTNGCQSQCDSSVRSILCPE